MGLRCQHDEDLVVIELVGQEPTHVADQIGLVVVEVDDVTAAFSKGLRSGHDDQFTHRGSFQAKARQEPGRVALPGGLSSGDLGTDVMPAMSLERSLAVRACFPPTAASVRAARSFVGSAVDGPAEVRDTAVLLTSELATNVVRHAATDFEVALRPLNATTVRVCVIDQSVGVPVIREKPDDAEAGRGMTLVATLAAAWGVDRQPHGKAVWFDLAPVSLRAGSGATGP
ncbi:MAG: ATP-binding protein [Actinobacteria bacterium]|nr:MAG: ATP-binding protein [Actinomycetota bacterium]